MLVKLSFKKSGESRAYRTAEYRWTDSPKSGLCIIDGGSPIEWSGLPPVIKAVNEDDNVSVLLNDIGERSDFLAQIAYQPDDAFDYVAPSGGLMGKYVDCGKDPNTGRPKIQLVQELRLLRGAMGPTLFRLISSASQGKSARDEIRIRIVVNPIGEKFELMARMVSSLFRLNQFLAIAADRGQAQAKVRRIWERGGDEGWNAYVEIDMMLLLMRRLVPVLRSIGTMSTSKTVVETRISKFARVKRFGRATLQRVLARGGFGEITGIGQNLMVPEQVKRMSLDLLSHRIVASFLRSRRRRSVQLISFLCRNVKQLRRAICEEVDVNKRTEMEASIASELRLAKKLSAVCSVVDNLLQMSAWSVADNGESIMMATPEDFSSTAAYREVYDILQSYERMQFVWKNMMGNRIASRLELSDRGESVWLKNYSYVYENWVLLRLVEAFSDCGFPVAAEYRKKILRDAIDVFLGQPNNSPVTVVAPGHEGLQVEIFHGVFAPVLDDDETREGFYCLKPHANSARPGVTPDFIIRFTDVRKESCEKPLSDRQYVIVADAKSTSLLGPKHIYKRDLYKDEVYRNNCGDGVHQSWLIYSGSASSSSVSGIEFSNIDMGTVCWQESIEGDSPSKNNVKKLWTNEGILGPGRERRLVGHVRVNAKTVSRDVFVEFVSCEIKTAMHYLGMNA